MKFKTLVWILVIVFAVAGVIDIIDGYIPKWISSVGLSFALLFFALGLNKPGEKKYNTFALVLALIAILAFVYRIFKHYQVF